MKYYNKLTIVILIILLILVSWNKYKIFQKKSFGLDIDYDPNLSIGQVWLCSENSKIIGNPFDISSNHLIYITNYIINISNGYVQYIQYDYSGVSTNSESIYVFELSSKRIK